MRTRRGRGGEAKLSLASSQPCTQLWHTVDVVLRLLLEELNGGHAHTPFVLGLRLFRIFTAQKTSKVSGKLQDVLGRPFKSREVESRT